MTRAERAEQKRAWQKANPERGVAATVRWQKKNPDRVRAYDRTSRLRREARIPGYAVAKATAWNRANPERHLDAQLRRGFGITIEDFRALLQAQGGVCAICKNTETVLRKKRLGVDHCHQTGRVRGLLCTRCNSAIGYLSDDKDRVLRALAYLGGA